MVIKPFVLYLNAKVSQLLLKCHFLLFEPYILLHDIVINKSNDLPFKQHENQTSETYDCQFSTRNVRQPKGSLTVWALYAYFSDSQNAAFELLVWCMQYQYNSWIKWQEPASKIFSKFLRTRELWRVERGGGLKFHENKKCFQKWFLHVFLIYLVGMVKIIENTICRVSTDHDNWWNCFKNKICL